MISPTYAIALRLTNDPDTAVRVFRRLAFSNLADLRPPRAVTLLLYTHPPVDERIRNVMDPSARAPEDGVDLSTGQASDKIHSHTRTNDPDVRARGT